MGRLRSTEQENQQSRILRKFKLKTMFQAVDCLLRHVMGALITCGRSGDLSNLVEACPLANIYQNSRSFCGGQYLSQDPSVSALLALPIMRCMCEHSEEVMNTYLLYSNSFSLSSVASSIASNINII